MAAPSNKAAIFATGDFIVSTVSEESFMRSEYYVVLNRMNIFKICKLDHYRTFPACWNTVLRHAAMSKNYPFRFVGRVVGTLNSAQSKAN